MSEIGSEFTKIRIAAIGDIHYKKTSQGALKELFSYIAKDADIFLLCGDFLDTGLPEEAHVLMNDLKEEMSIPIVSVFGNHEHEAGMIEEVYHILTEAGIIVLRGTNCEVHGIGFAGAKGFAGGFRPRMLQPWGEEAMKHFVQECVNEATKLEAALASLTTAHRIVLLHYSPVRETVVGEDPEIFPFLGSSRIEDVLIRHHVDAVFHGHAHLGSPEGNAGGTIPVFNVAMKVLSQAFPHRLPFHMFELHTESK